MDVREFVDRLPRWVWTRRRLRRPAPHPARTPDAASSEALTICIEFAPERLDEADRDHLLELLTKHLPAKERAAAR